MKNLNWDRTFINLQEELEADDYTLYSSELVIPLGKDTNWKSHFLDFKETNALLIAGATASGKSLFLNTILYTLIKRLSPDQIKFVLIDPKRVEFPPYKESPYLYTDIVQEPSECVKTLIELTKEMDRRFELLADREELDIESYNYSQKDKLPYIFILIDELSDLMFTDGKNCEESLENLCQMGRAVGIHLVIATSRPEKSVLTDILRGNILNHIGFATASIEGSKIIIDEAGAESLLGKGDALLSLPHYSRLVRVQTPYLSDEEIKDNIKLHR